MRLRRTALRASPPGWTPSLGLPKGQKIKSHIKSQADQKIVRSRPEPSAASTGRLSTSIEAWSAVRPPSRAGSLPQWDRVHPPELGRLSGRHRWQASSNRKTSTPPHAAHAAPLNTMSASSSTAFDLRAPVGRLSGGVDPGVGAQRPFGEAKHIERRCSEANRRRCARINPAAKEPEPKRGPNVRVKPFRLPFRRLEKVTRRKGHPFQGLR